MNFKLALLALASLTGSTVFETLVSTGTSWAVSNVSKVRRWLFQSSENLVSSAGSSVIQHLIDTALVYLQEQMLPANSEAELRRLRTALPQITAVIHIAEALKMKDPRVSSWINQFRKAVEASEDVLDEFEYKMLEDLVKNGDEACGSAPRSKKRKLCPTNNDTLARLKEAVTMLDLAAAETQHLLQLATELGIRDLPVVRQETTSFIVEREVFGRDVEKNKIISWLKRPTNTRLSSFGISGLGGLGKTTLLRFAYEEMYRSNHFDKRIWVCVSTNFSVEKITRKMLGELGESSSSGQSLNSLQETLKEKVLSKKILLVLDDVWEDEKRSDWEKLIAPLRFVQEGSKILFTTRMKSVESLLASVINSEHESLALRGLGEQELRLLFYTYAFNGFNLDNHRDLQAIGDQILKMLCGSPLAAETIGSLLNSLMDNRYWRRVLNHGSILNIEQAKDVVEILKLSYYHLPADLQVCFKFCSIFPKDHQYDKDELIKMWMAVGIIQQEGRYGKRPEDIGEDYFNHLLGKSFFEHSKSWEGERYAMHDLMHELARIVSTGECCRIEPNDKYITIPNTVRHVSVHESEMEKVFHLENLRSLVITTSIEEIGINPDLFVLPNNSIKKSLRLLKICGSKYCELPKEIGCLVHLRYLSIKPYFVNQTCQYSLLASIYKLCHLQVLEFSTVGDNSSYLGIETIGMTDLPRLRYLRLPEEIRQNIHGVHKLTSLQELSFFIGKESGYCINELATLNDLRHLSIINIENVGNPAEAKSANLLLKDNLMSLSLKWTSQSNSDNPEQIIDCLQPHSNLMELTIENYKGERFPSWMEMQNLQILDIRNCVSIDNLPVMPFSLIEFRVHNVSLTSLPYLKRSYTQQSFLESSSLRVVKIESCPNLILLHGFLEQPNLDLAIEDFTISSCEKLALVPAGSFGILLSLKHLTIEYCPNLAECFSLPLSLTELCLHNIGVSDLPNYYQYYGSSDSSDGPSASSLKSTLRKVRISNCENLKSLNGFFKQDGIDFMCIEQIEITNCKNLVHLPVSAFGRFASLQTLTICDCPMLMRVENQNSLLPMELKDLSIENCGELDEQLLESASSLATLTDLSIINCANISRIPFSENTFESLNSLSINGCDKLIEHSFREQAHGVNQGGNLASLKLSRLEIDHLALLFIEPLRSLGFVGYLRVGYCSGIEALPEKWFMQNSSTLGWLSIRNASTLKSLPATLSRLTSLKWLEIWQADLLRELPELPASLRSLVIRDASSLRSLPATMARHSALEWLEIWKADLLEELPELPVSLKEKYIEGRGVTSQFGMFPRSYQSLV